MIIHKTINVGDKIGRWTVIEEADPVPCGGRNIRMWLCKCECGTIRVVREPSLKTEVSKSCGCLHSEIMKDVGKIHTTHGMSNSRLYAIYKHMRNRCYNKNDNRYYCYGAKGITICDEWLNSFETFMEWSMNNGYTDGLSIDRIDCSKMYCPDNCRWVDINVQANNKSTNRVYEYNDEKHTIAEWARIYNMNYKKLWKRLVAFGWDVERALTT